MRSQALGMMIIEVLMLYRTLASADHACLTYILRNLHQRNRLPPPETDKGVLSSDQVVVKQRHTLFSEWVVTGGVGGKKELHRSSLRKAILGVQSCSLI